MKSFHQPVKALVTQLNNPSPSIIQKNNFIHSRERIAEHLRTVFECSKRYMPKQKKLYVISLASGVPDEYIALRSYYGSEYQIDFTGIDIDSKVNAEIKVMFSAFKQNFRILTGDASDPVAVHKTVLDAKALPPSGGFDFVFLRHPDMLTSPRNIQFIKMILETIPFIASESAKIFFSFYNSVEVDAFLVAANPPASYAYSKPGPNNCSITDSFLKTEVAPGKVVEINKYCTIMDCKGTFFNAGLKKTVQSKLIAATSADSKEAQTTIEYADTVQPYVKSLKDLIDMDSKNMNLITYDSKTSKVRFVNSWLKQLSQTALEELITELSGQYYKRDLG